MITPAKWQTAEADQRIASKMSYGEFRKKLVPHMREVVFYPQSVDVFDIYQIDGITYFLLDKDIHRDSVVTNRCSIQKYFCQKDTRGILSQETLYNIGNTIVESLGQYKKFEFSYITGKRYQVWINNQVSGSGSRFMSNDGASMVLGVTRIVDQKSNSKDEDLPVAQSCVFSSDDRIECEYFVQWINTKFNRFFVAINISKLTGILTNHCFRFVPTPMVLDYDGNRVCGKFDHIYTDEELYQTWNLPQKYIDVIEATIKNKQDNSIYAMDDKFNRLYRKAYVLKHLCVTRPNEHSLITLTDMMAQYIKPIYSKGNEIYQIDKLVQMLNKYKASKSTKLQIDIVTHDEAIIDASLDDVLHIVDSYFPDVINGKVYSEFIQLTNEYKTSTQIDCDLNYIKDKVLEYAEIIADVAILICAIRCQSVASDLHYKNIHCLDSRGVKIEFCDL